MWEPQAATSSHPDPPYQPLLFCCDYSACRLNGPTNKTDKTSEIRKLVSRRSEGERVELALCLAGLGLSFSRGCCPSVKTKASEASMCLSLWQRPHRATTTTRVGFFDKPPAQKPRAVYLNALAERRFGMRGEGGVCIVLGLLFNRH